VAEKGWRTGLGTSAWHGARVEGSQSRTQKDQLSCAIGLGSTMELDSHGRSDGERRMAVANAFGQRGSKCVTAAPWESPMMA
jgi:hypothetical protein